MNYLETGLPHTDFCRRKTDFSPPRYIPLCGGLGRKYLGLEPLTRREVAVLTRRLSEPKRGPEEEEQIQILTQVRRRTPKGTGRFIGQKRMSSFEIEKMVERLYSRRATKDYAFVDESVEASDILNMTTRHDESSESEEEGDESKVVKDRENSLLRKQTIARVNTDIERKRSPSFKRECISVHETPKSGRSRVFSVNKTPTENLSAKLENRPTRSVSFQRPKSLIENRNQINEYQSHSDKVVTKSCEWVNSNKPENNKAFITKGPRRCKSEEVALEKINDITAAHSFHNFANGPVSYAVDITHPSPSKWEIPRLAGIGEKTLKDVDKSTTKDENAIENRSASSDKVKSPGIPSRHESPRQKPNRTEETKSVRYTAAPCDELLIDRVATFNRSSKPRCK